MASATQPASKENDSLMVMTDCPGNILIEDIDSKDKTEQKSDENRLDSTQELLVDD